MIVAATMRTYYFDGGLFRGPIRPLDKNPFKKVTIHEGSFAGRTFVVDMTENHIAIAEMKDGRQIPLERSIPYEIWSANKPEPEGSMK